MADIEDVTQQNLYTYTVDTDFRTIKIPDNKDIFGVVGDICVNRVKFEIPRYCSGYDLSEFTARIDYVNANGDPNYYEATEIKSEDDYTISFVWEFTSDVTLPHRHRDFWQMPCAMGADLSQGDDFCSFTFLFPLRDGSFGIKTRNYISSLTLKKLPGAMRTKYDDFMKEGSLIVLEGTILDMTAVYEDLDQHIIDSDYDVRCFGYDPYGAKEFVGRWETENGPYGIEKVPQGAKTESIPLGELKKLSEERMLIFDEEIMTFAMGNCITLEDTNGNRKLYKRKREHKIDCVAAMMDAFVAWKEHKEEFE